MSTGWEGNVQNLSEAFQIERTLNFATMPQDEDFGLSRARVTRMLKNSQLNATNKNPISHRVVEKRRRDRMNNCLADLSRLIPLAYVKKGRGRIEKTEIIEMAIKHLRHLQAHACKEPGTCQLAQNLDRDVQIQHGMGYQECTSEMVRFLVEEEGFFPNEGLCYRLVNHLHEHYDKLIKVGYYQQNDASKTMSIIENSKNGLQLDLCNTTKLMEGGRLYSHILEPQSVTTSAALFAEHRPLGSGLSSQSDTNMTHSKEISEVENENIKTDSRNACYPEIVSNFGKRMVQNQGQDDLKFPPGKRFCSSSSSVSSQCTTSSSISSQITTGSYNSMRPPLSTSSPDSWSQSRSEEAYKFKNNIKERFDADSLNQDGNRSSSLSETSKNLVRSVISPGHFTSQFYQGCAVTDGFNNSMKSSFAKPFNLSSSDSQQDRLYAETQMDNSSSSSQSPCSSSGYSTSGYSTSNDRPTSPKPMKCKLLPEPQSPGPPEKIPEQVSESLQCLTLKESKQTPVFALHPKGCFYVPLTVDSKIISPYLQERDDSLSVLHPVSISVKFCRRFKTKEIV